MVDHTVPMPGTDAREWYDKGVHAEAVAARAVFTDPAFDVVEVIAALCDSDRAADTPAAIVRQLAGIWCAPRPLFERLRFAWRILTGSTKT